jgi:3-isopropylmalate dehydrogenase
MLLEWLARRHSRGDLATAAAAMSGAVDVLLAKPATRTVDLGGALGTRAFATSLIHEIATSARP